MAKRVNRKLYLWTLQAHEPDGQYDRIFSTLRDLDRARRVAEVGYKTIFLSDVYPVNGGLAFRAYAIRSETDYTTFDVAEFTTSDESLPRNKRFAVAAHGYFITHSRKMYFEYVRGGPKAEETVEAIQQILRSVGQDFRRLRLLATPVIDEKFLADVSRLERIRTVRMDVVEPNPGWGDWDDALGDLGDASDADHISLSATAKRGESLKKRGGIVGLLREAIRQANSHLSKAVVTGRMEGSTAETTLRTDNSQKFETRSVTTDSGGSTNEASIRVAFESLPSVRNPN